MTSAHFHSGDHDTERLSSPYTGRVQFLVWTPQKGNEMVCVTYCREHLAWGKYTCMGRIVVALIVKLGLLASE